MKQLFLTSSVHAVAKDIAKKVDLSKRNRLVFIDTAAEPEKGDKTWLLNDRQALADAGFKANNYSITDKTENEIKKYLSKFDYLYLSGGNTAYLLYQSQKSGFIQTIRELILNKGKTYIGTSAGSIIAGPKLPDYLIKENKDFKVDDPTCYGFVNFSIVPHWGSDGFKNVYLNKRLKIAYYENQVPLLILTDTQYVYVKENQMEIVDTNKIKQS